MKIRWHWGTKAVIVLGLMMAMVAAFVTVMIRQDVSLVEPDYYPKGQAFQKTIHAMENTIPYKDQITVETEPGILRISFPSYFRPEDFSGKLHLYNRVSDKGDRNVELIPDSTGTFTYPTQGLKGRYILKMLWSQDSLDYYTEKSITID